MQLGVKSGPHGHGVIARPAKGNVFVFRHDGEDLREVDHVELIVPTDVAERAWDEGDFTDVTVVEQDENDPNFYRIAGDVGRAVLAIKNSRNSVSVAVQSFREIPRLP